MDFPCILIVYLYQVYLQGAMRGCLSFMQITGCEEPAQVAAGY